VFWSSIRQNFAPLFWIMVTCNLIIPFPLLAIKRFRTITGTVIASSTIVAGMWIERFLIIVPTLEHKFLPYSWGTYRPTWVEITLMVAGFGMMTLLYLLFSKLVPMISMWELEAGVRKAPIYRGRAAAFEPSGARARAGVREAEPLATDLSR
jgi:Ni/Fe-hydrogenase subunit HybB-like protein